MGAQGSRAARHVVAIIAETNIGIAVMIRDPDGQIIGS